jgi:inner membrane transporter RhtA
MDALPAALAGDLPDRPGSLRLSPVPGGTTGDRLPPELLFLLSASAQYGGAVIAVGLFDEVGPATLAWLRVLIGGLALLLIVGPRGGAAWTRRDAVLAGTFGAVTALMNLPFYLAIDRLPLGKGVTIEFIGPIAVAAATTRTARNAGALALAATGVVVLGGVEIGDEPLGLFFILLASVMWAGYIVAGSRIALADRGLSGLAVGLVAGSLVIAPFGVPGAGAALASPGILAGCVAVGVLSSAIAYGIDQGVLRRIPVRRFSVMLALLPVTASVFGLVFLGQRPNGLDMAGMALVLTGVAVQERERHHRPHLEELTA